MSRLCRNSCGLHMYNFDTRIEFPKQSILIKKISLMESLLLCIWRFVNWVCMLFPLSTGWKKERFLLHLEPSALAKLGNSWCLSSVSFVYFVNLHACMQRKFVHEETNFRSHQKILLTTILLVSCSSFQRLSLYFLRQYA